MQSPYPCASRAEHQDDEYPLYTGYMGMVYGGTGLYSGSLYSRTEIAKEQPAKTGRLLFLNRILFQSFGELSGQIPAQNSADARH